MVQARTLTLTLTLNRSYSQQGVRLHDDAAATVAEHEQIDTIYI
jgi:hypothetical protein